MKTDNKKINIKIPKADEKEVVVIPRGEFGNIKKKLDDMKHIISSINIVVILSMIAIIVSVTGLFLDQMRYNNAAYKEYSQKTESVENTQKINRELLEQNKKNQEIIIEQQNQILELLNKK